MSSHLVKKWVDLEQCGRRLCLRNLDINWDDSKTTDDMLDQCEKLFKNLEVDMP